MGWEGRRPPGVCSGTGDRTATEDRGEDGHQQGSNELMGHGEAGDLKLLPQGEDSKNHLDGPPGPSPPGPEALQMAAASGQGEAADRHGQHRCGCRVGAEAMSQQPAAGIACGQDRRSAAHWLAMLPPRTHWLRRPGTSARPARARNRMGGDRLGRRQP